MEIRNRQQTLAIVAIAAVALLASDHLIFSPLKEHWKARAERITELKKNVNQGALLLKREQTVQSRWDNMRTNTLPNNLSAAESEVLRRLIGGRKRAGSASVPANPSGGGIPTTL